MKLNWGNALLLFFIFYVGTLAFVLYKSTTVDHSLVVDNYYEHDINYQQRYDKISNRKLLKHDLNIQYNQKSGEINFNFGPDANVIKADVEMYRASDKLADYSTSLDIFDADIYRIPVSDLQPGKWKVKVEWSDNERTYYKEKDIYK